MPFVPNALHSDIRRRNSCAAATARDLGTLNADDRIRGAVIGQLMCHGFVDVRAIEEPHGISFADYFREALEQLRPHARDGLVTLDDQGIAVTGKGRLLLRSIAMCFDRYLDPPSVAAGVSRFSKVV